MEEHPAELAWYCVRTVCRFSRKPMSVYEERMTLWRTAGFAAAIALAEAEGREYASTLVECSYAGLAQAYELAEEPGHGAEVFSLMRDSDLPADAYVSAFFDTGEERQG